MLFLDSAQESALVTRIEKAYEARCKSGDTETAKRFRISYWESIELLMALAAFGDRLRHLRATNPKALAKANRALEITQADINEVHDQVACTSTGLSSTNMYFCAKDLAILWIALKYEAKCK